MKKMVKVLCVLVLVVFMAGAASAANVTLKLANAGPADPEDRTVIAVELFRNHVQNKTGGSVKIEVFHASQLGNEKEILEGLKMGTIELGTITTGPVPTLFKPIMVFDIPYLFPNQVVAWEVLDGPFGRKLMEEMRKVTGIRTLAVSENGYRHFVTSEKQIKSVADMKGLKIRTMENPAHMKMVEALGASPTPVAFGELYMALQQGVVDGCELPMTLINNGKYYEVQKYTILDGHLYNPLIMFVNDNVWEKLSEDQKAALYEGARLFNITQRAISERQVQSGILNVTEKGMTVYVPTAAQLNEFRSVSQPPVLDYVKSQAGEQWVKEALEAVAAAEAKMAEMLK
ncbi:DctP family TRAP transporter solute-binding subunit [Aminivibrio sp.]|uniref:DctP family TRAP transporter solute-binding subunit n=1 Tax=Aminivibrio sp. TaxID=1872489 RepID=UPI001A3B1247|nr:DctP family TRAP transporter solute-binding subunit [Aminivibrio sp.]MBL3538264.1 DctP family TRAP transporter solute-binding subunit [Aminivibrio sp.]